MNLNLWFNNMMEINSSAYTLVYIVLYAIIIIATIILTLKFIKLCKEF